MPDATLEPGMSPGKTSRVGIVMGNGFHIGAAMRDARRQLVLGTLERALGNQMQALLTEAS